jgi:oxalate decarboxylase
MTHTPPQMIMDTLKISREDLARFPNNRPDILPV